jgi:creatinine amidohydrolase
VEVDSQLGEQVAIRTAKLVDARGHRIVVLPMLWTGISEHHMSFGGTITLDLPTFSAVIEGICRSLVRHGFKRIVLLNAHGGNDNALRSLTDELSPKLGVPIVQFTYWDASADVIGAILEKQPQVQHACEAETAMMMAVRPDLVATDRIPLAKANRTPDAPEIVGAGVYRWRTLGAMSASGVVGHPEAATAEKGNRLFDGITRSLADKLCNPELWQMQWQSERLA